MNFPGRGSRVLPLVFLATFALWAQASKTFEVVSIRLRTPGTEAIRNSLGLVRISGTDITGSAMSVQDLIFYAYLIRPFQFGPTDSWVASDRYNILAKAPGDLTVGKDQVREMFKAVLSDRFQLKLKAEKREMAVYALRVAPGGIKFRKASDPASLPPRRVNRQDGVQEFGEGSMTLEQLVTLLSVNTDRPIVDLTGLDGAYMVSIKFVPDRLLVAADAPAGVSIYKAVENQLGLKLEATKLPVDYLTIEHVERPSEN